MRAASLLSPSQSPNCGVSDQEPEESNGEEGWDFNADFSEFSVDD